MRGFTGRVLLALSSLGLSGAASADYEVRFVGEVSAWASLVVPTTELIEDQPFVYVATFVLDDSEEFWTLAISSLESSGPLVDEAYALSWQGLIGTGQAEMASLANEIENAPESLSVQFSLVTGTILFGEYESLSLDIDKLAGTGSFATGFGDICGVCDYSHRFPEVSGDIQAIRIVSDKSPGDFNRDGLVDAADYTLLRDGMGRLYDTQDLADWRASFGWQLAGESVPEPTASMLVFLVVVGVKLWHSRA